MQTHEMQILPVDVIPRLPITRGGGVLSSGPILLFSRLHGWNIGCCVEESACAHDWHQYVSRARDITHWAYMPPTPGRADG